MAIDKQLINKKLSTLKDYIYQIETMEFSLEDLKSDRDIQHLVSFRLQQAVETGIDIATHLISGLNLERKESAGDAFQVLADNNVIKKDLAKNMASAAGFRNIIVHGYDEINFEMVYRDYKKDLEDLRDFAKQVHGYL